MPKHKTKGPLTFQGAPLTLKLAPDGSIRLLVVARAGGELGQPAELRLYAAAAGDASCDAGADADADAGADADADAGVGDAKQQVLLQLAPRSDCVITARRGPAAPPPAPAAARGAAGEILLDEVQRHNLRLLPGEAYEFAPFSPPGKAPPAGSFEAGALGSSGGGGGQEGAGGLNSDSVDADEPEPFDLVDLEVEVRLADPALFGFGSGDDTGGGGGGGDSGDGSEAAAAAAGTAVTGGEVEADAEAVARALSRAYFGRVVCLNEYLALRAAGLPLLLRVTGANTLTADEQEEAAAYHCFRGRVTPETVVYLQEAPGLSGPGAAEAAGGDGARGGGAAAAAGGRRGAAAGEEESGGGSGSGSSSDEEDGEESSSGGASDEEGGAPRPPPAQTRVLRGARLRLRGARARAERPPPTNVVHVTTSDGEWFPVKKRLLRPCIALTQVVRDAGSSAPSVTVNIDTLTFDRVLIYLEALALGREPPEFALHLVDGLLGAAAELGLRPLEEYCQRRLGQRLAALGTYTAADVRRATAEGKVWLVIQGMVLDVSRWLPQHPGGSTIIPRQALDCDCSRLFELYHASRESFLYLREFYIGELLPGEEEQLPQGGGNPAPPSADFLEQLAHYTAGFRMPPGQLPQGRAFKSF